MKEQLHIWDEFERHKTENSGVRVRARARDAGEALEAQHKERLAAASERLRAEHNRRLEQDYRDHGLQPVRTKAGMLVSLPMMLKLGHTIESIHASQRESVVPDQVVF